MAALSSSEFNAIASEARAAIAAGAVSPETGLWLVVVAARVAGRGGVRAQRVELEQRAELVSAGR